MIKVVKVFAWSIYILILFCSGVLIGGFLIPYLVIRKHRENKVKRNQANSLDRIANALEVKQWKQTT